jgi:hypothetical protein
MNYNNNVQIYSYLFNNIFFVEKRILNLKRGVYLAIFFFALYINYQIIIFYKIL